MSGGARLLVMIVVGGVLLLSVSVGLAAASIVRGGSVAVEVHEDDGADVSVIAPAALIDLVLFFVPDHSLSMALEYSDLGHEIGNDPALAEIEAIVPAVRDAWRELVDAPDFTIVEVKGDGHHIEVEKLRDRLVVRVHDGDSSMDIALPLRTVSHALRKI